MESFGPWKFIKMGFWIGIGFIIPSIAVYILGTYLVYSIPSLGQGAGMENSKEMMEKFMKERDKTDQVKIVQFREVKQGKQLLVLGTVENIGATPVGSILVEAELLDDTKQMVFECSKYISKQLKRAEKENFQIICGLGDQVVPDYKSVNVRVVQASNY